jgi:hypothetical protein
MNHQDIAKLLIVIMTVVACIGIWLACRPVWTVRFKGKAESVQFRRYTSFGLRRAADAYRLKHKLGHYKIRKGGYDQA